MNHIGERTYSPPEAEQAPTQPNPMNDLVTYLREYARERPEVVALWAFGIGFLLGWRLKPW